MNVILELLEKKSQKKFKTSLHSVKKYSNLLNKELFENKLTPITYIDIRKRRKRWAEYAYLDDGKSLLKMNDQYESFEFFLNILGHELIHHYQCLFNNKKLSHGKTFNCWKQKFKEKGLHLRVKY